MKFVSLIFLCAGLLAGCASNPQNKFSKTPGPSQPSQPQAVVMPDTSLAAKVVSYNSVGRFAVLSFPVGELPRNGQTFFLYRSGLKVGEVNITGPQRGNDIVADLVSGDAQVGDEVRQQ